MAVSYTHLDVYKRQICGFCVLACFEKKKSISTGFLLLEIISLVLLSRVNNLSWLMSKPLPSNAKLLINIIVIVAIKAKNILIFAPAVFAAKAQN